MAQMMTRKRFLQLGLGMPGALLVMQKMGCGGGGDDEGDGATTTSTSTTTTGTTTTATTTSTTTTTTTGETTAGTTAADTATAACTTDVDATIEDNHPQGSHHELTVPLADIEAGTSKTYDLMNLADHNHEVVLTADHFSMLSQGMEIMVISTTDDSDTAGLHAHNIIVSC